MKRPIDLDLNRPTPASDLSRFYFCRQRGDAMWPRLADGDEAAIDRTNCRPVAEAGGALFLIEDGVEVIRRVELVQDDVLRVITENPRSHYDRPLGEVTILGRVEWRLVTPAYPAPPAAA